jgi:hypothetical protein
MSHRRVVASENIRLSSHDPHQRFDMGRIAKPRLWPWIGDPKKDGVGYHRKPAGCQPRARRGFPGRERPLPVLRPSCAVALSRSTVSGRCFFAPPSSRASCSRCGPWAVQRSPCRRVSATTGVRAPSRQFLRSRLPTWRSAAPVWGHLVRTVGSLPTRASPRGIGCRLRSMVAATTLPLLPPSR